MPLVIDKRIIVEMINLIGGETNESGGIIGCSVEGVIDAFYFDRGKRSSYTEYVPNIDTLQNQLDKWNDSHVRFVGIVHSHKNDEKLSNQDIFMAREIIKENPTIDAILMPILLLRNQRLYFYEVSERNVQPLKYNIINGRNKYD